MIAAKIVSGSRCFVRSRCSTKHRDYHLPEGEGISTVTPCGPTLPARVRASLQASISLHSMRSRSFTVDPSHPGPPPQGEGAGRRCHASQSHPTIPKAEEEYRRATTLEEELACLQVMLKEIPKHKGTDHLQADLKAKIAKAQEGPVAEKSSGRRTAGASASHGRGPARRSSWAGPTPARAN